MQPDPRPTTPVSFVGNLTETPQLKKSKADKLYLPLTVAVSRPLVEGDWKGEKATDYRQAVAFGSMAERASQSLRRGDRVVVTGRTVTRRWQGRDGTEREEESVVVDGLGPDLRFNSATVRRPTRDKAAASEKPF